MHFARPEPRDFSSLEREASPVSQEQMALAFERNPDLLR